MNNPLMISAVFMAFGIAISASWWIKRKIDQIAAEEKAQSRAPFVEKMLRPAGEGLRLKIEGMQDEILEVSMLMAIYLVSPVFGILIAANKLSWFSLGVWVIVSALAFWLAYSQWMKLVELRNQRRNLSLGFDGERYVAEKLMPVVGMGYRVFHDMEVDWIPGKKFNIDHVVVGTNGVFVIETKARRKKNGELPDGSHSHEVRLAGGMLHFPMEKPTDEPLVQARMNAEILGRWLKGSGAGTVPVYPVLVFPGWYVREEEVGDVRVVNGKNLEKWLPKFPTTGAFDERERMRIIDKIEQHCRNVEL